MAPREARYIQSSPMRARAAKRDLMFAKGRRFGLPDESGWLTTGVLFAPSSLDLALVCLYGSMNWSLGLAVEKASAWNWVNRCEKLMKLKS